MSNRTISASFLVSWILSTLEFGVIVITSAASSKSSGLIIEFPLFISCILASSSFYYNRKSITYFISLLTQLLWIIYTCYIQIAITTNIYKMRILPVFSNSLADVQSSPTIISSWFNIPVSMESIIVVSLYTLSLVFTILTLFASSNLRSVVKTTSNSSIKHTIAKENNPYLFRQPSLPILNEKRTQSFPRLTNRPESALYAPSLQRNEFLVSHQPITPVIYSTANSQSRPNSSEMGDLFLVDSSPQKESARDVEKPQKSIIDSEPMIAQSAFESNTSTIEFPTIGRVANPFDDIYSNNNVSSHKNEPVRNNYKRESQRQYTSSKGMHSKVRNYMNKRYGNGIASSPLQHEYRLNIDSESTSSPLQHEHRLNIDSDGNSIENPYGRISNFPRHPLSSHSQYS